MAAMKEGWGWGQTMVSQKQVDKRNQLSTLSMKGGRTWGQEITFWVLENVMKGTLKWLQRDIFKKLRSF